MLPCMEQHVSLEHRLAGHLPPRSEPLRREVFERSATGGLRHRILAQVDRAIEIFEVDRLLYDVEIEAQQRWLRRMMAFDAYYARREAARASGQSAEPPVR
jgi:hypothetical protein